MRVGFWWPNPSREKPKKQKGKEEEEEDEKGQKGIKDEKRGEAEKELNLHAASGRVHDNRQQSIVTTTATTTATNSQQPKSPTGKYGHKSKRLLQKSRKEKKDETVE